MANRVLVTGATGFVGHHSLPDLAARGFEVHAVHATGQPGPVATWHRVDLHDRAAVDRLLDEVRPTHLLHFAWYVEHGKFWKSPENLRWVESSLALLRGFADRGGIRVAIAGTCAEYDWAHGFCSEGVTPLAPASLYGTSKHALHLASAKFAESVGLSLAWGRLFFPYGLGEPTHKLIPSVARSIHEGRPVRCSHGRHYRDFLHARDCGEAFTALLDGPVEGPVNVGSGHPVTIGEVVRTIAALVPGGDRVPIEFGAVPTPPDDPPMLVADVRRLTNEVGWAPRFNLREGLTETLISMGLPVDV